MDTEDAPKSLPAAATAPALPADDPRLTAEVIAHRRANGIVERDEHGRLLPGSQLPNKGRKPSVMITTLAGQHTEAAIRVPGEIMEYPKAPSASRVAVSIVLLDEGWGKAPVQIDVQARANFTDFLRDVGLAATSAHDHPDGEVVE